MDIKSITFIEEAEAGFDSIVQVARLWYERNVGHIVIEGGIFGIIPDNTTGNEDKDNYLRTLRIKYRGIPVSANPQECDHPIEELTAIVAEQPTCHKTGIRRFICNKCGRVASQELIPRLVHDFVWAYNNDAKCLKDGTETGICSKCGDRLSRIKHGSALGHNHVFTFDDNASCLADGTETGVCTRCEDTIIRTKVDSKLGHAWSAWITEVQPTYETEGLKARSCSRCGDRETQTIPRMIMNISITTAALNGGVVNDRYSASLQTNAPAGSPVRWSITSGALPPGVTLNSDGTLSGIFNTVGTYSFTVKATCYTATATKNFSINVANGNFTVTFNANGGSCSERTRKVAAGSMIGNLPTASKSGSEFGGWFTAATGGLKIDSTYSVSANVTLYARWGKSSGIQFGDATSQFNIQYEGDRTNYGNNPYTLYHRIAKGAAGTSNLTLQTGIASSNGTNTANMTSSNKRITLYLKVTNNGDAGNFDIGFDCDSYVDGSDSVPVKRISRGVQLGSGPYYRVTVPYTHTAWVGHYGQRTQNRYVNSAVNTTSSGDSGYAFTMNNIFINSGSYVILEVTFQKP